MRSTRCAAVSCMRLEPQEGQLISSRGDKRTSSIGLRQCGQRMCIGRFPEGQHATAIISPPEAHRQRKGFSVAQRPFTRHNILKLLDTRLPAHVPTWGPIPMRSTALLSLVLLTSSLSAGC